jgi:hypothetical protein
MRGHGPCVALRLRQRNEFAVTRWLQRFWSATPLVVLDGGVHGVCRPGIARRAFRGPRETVRPLEAVGKRFATRPSDAVLALRATSLVACAETDARIELPERFNAPTSE